MGQLSESTPHPGLNFISITSCQQKNGEQMDEYVRALTKVLLNSQKKETSLQIFQTNHCFFSLVVFFRIFVEFTATMWHKKSAIT